MKEDVESEEQLNRSLDDVIELLLQEIERVKESLETYLQAMLVAQRDPAEVH